MRSSFTLLACIAFGLLPVMPANAAPVDRQLVFDGGQMGQVIFDGRLHAEKGNKCSSCHPRLFMMHKGATKIRYADHGSGKNACFACHNGTNVFSPSGNCYRCHKHQAPAKAPANTPDNTKTP
ncbi:MAG: cytochrome C [Nitrospirae bacterium]|nr:cytochrome C [Nitrospirota bacterium]